MNLTQAQRRKFAAAYLRTMDPDRAARSIGRGDGAALLEQDELRGEIARLRERLGELLRPEDVTRAAAALAFGRANDCVRLVLEDGCDVESLDLTMLSEVKRSDKGAVEVRLIDRLAALEFLAGRGAGQNDAAAQFLQAMAGACGPNEDEA